MFTRLAESFADSDPTGGLTRLGLAPGNSRLFDAIVERAPVGIFVTDASGACLYANACLCELTGVPFEQQLGYGWRGALHPADGERVAASWEAAAAAGAELAHDQRFVRPDGSVAWVEMTAVPMRDSGGSVVGWAGACVDVTERRLSEIRYSELVENARDAIYAADPAGNLVAVNQAAEEMTGYGREELLGMNFLDLVAPEDVEAVKASMARSISGADESRLVLSLTSRDGRRVDVDVTGRLVEENGVPVRFEGIARDMTEQHALQERLAHQAFHDPLTGLPNRLLLIDRLGPALARADRIGAPVTVILLDLDNFKLVNDSLGHDAGDQLLRVVASRLVQTIRDGDTVARLGGDEFAFLLEALKDEREVIVTVERIIAALRKPFAFDGYVQQVSGSLGVVLAYPGDDPGDVLRNADTALYSAKAHNKGGCELFDDTMRSRLLREIAIKNALADALISEQLELYYQPIVSLDHGHVLGVEALVRWRHPEWGWLQPSEFIPIAEADGLIIPLGRYVLAEAVKQAALWHDIHPDLLPLGIAVNVAPFELTIPGYAAQVLNTLGDHGVSPTQLGIEITERSFVDEHNTTIANNIRELAAAGIRLSLDDFGTGYSALASLKRLPFTAIKIDRYFIRNIRTPNDRPPISTAVASLGKALGLVVIAEGIETAIQEHVVRRLGCDAAQGYHYARPQPADALTTYLTTTSPTNQQTAAHG